MYLYLNFNANNVPARNFTVPLPDSEWKCPFCKTGIYFTFLEIMPFLVMVAATSSGVMSDILMGAGTSANCSPVCEQKNYQRIPDQETRICPVLLQDIPQL